MSSSGLWIGPVKTSSGRGVTGLSERMLCFRCKKKPKFTVASASSVEERAGDSRRKRSCSREESVATLEEKQDESGSIVFVSTTNFHRSMMLALAERLVSGEDFPRRNDAKRRCSCLVAVALAKTSVEANSSASDRVDGPQD